MLIFATRSVARAWSHAWENFHHEKGEDIPQIKDRSYAFIFGASMGGGCRVMRWHDPSVNFSLEL